MRRERSLENAKHPWRVGDLCTAIYGDVGEGLIYRVVHITDTSSAGTWSRPWDKELRVVPVFGVIADTMGRKPRKLGAGWCTPLSLVDLATEYTRFGLFIANEAKKRSESTATEDESPADAAEVPAGDAGDVEGRASDVDGGGLCADIAARSERR